MYAVLIVLFCEILREYQNFKRTKPRLSERFEFVKREKAM